MWSNYNLMHKILIFPPEVTKVISINSQFLANYLSVHNICQYLSTLLIKIEQDKPKEKTLPFDPNWSFNATVSG